MRTVTGNRSCSRRDASMKARMPAIGSTYHRLRAGPLACALRGACALRVIIATLAAIALCASQAAASTLLIAGAGDGHGVGMSQEGALGYAQRGYSCGAILEHYYAGTTLGQAPPGAYVRVLVGSKVQRIPLERYVRGVVAAEMPSSWPAATLEAQAVASRTYALTAHAGASRFDVYSDTRSQVYRGVAAETPQSNAAVAATAGQIVTYAGKPAITYFYASSGGMTENVENVFLGSVPEPWLKGVSDPFDRGPSFEWKLSISFAVATARLTGLVKGGFQGIEVLTRGVSPRIVSAEVLGTGGPTLVTGPELAARLGLQDSWAYFSVMSGASVTPEPDLSGLPRTGAASPPRPVRSRPQRGGRAAGGSRATVVGPQGGARAPDGPESTITGGAAAR
jgi:SpoIID/LytB domain protein